MLNWNKQTNHIVMEMHKLEKSLNLDKINKLCLLIIGQNMKKRNPNF